MLYSVNDSDLANTPTGDVTDLEGDDIIFRGIDDATCGGPGTAPCQLDHEIEEYVPGSGKFVAWVRIPSVNANPGPDTVIQILYGNSAITTSTEKPYRCLDQRLCRRVAFE